MKLGPYLEVIIAAIIAGSAGVFIKLLSLPVMTIAWFRTGIPVLFLIIFFIIKRSNPFKKINKFMIFASFLSAIRMIFYFIGFTFTSIGNAVVLVYTWPIFSAILGFIFLKEEIIKRNVYLMFVSFVGILLIYLQSIYSFNHQDIVGMSSIIFSSLLYASTIVIFKKDFKNHTKYEDIFYQNFIGAILFLPFIFFNFQVTTSKIILSTIYGILIGVVVFTLFFSALRKIDVAIASHIFYIEVISGILFGAFIFQEKITWNIVVGALMIILSTAFIKKNISISKQPSD
jgi:drug/metabolite transporter (DMT)-like permease